MSPARIQALTAAVANQISAGEVIERPASVVKELLENALDSGADTISIEIGYGGLNQIKISDNGAGILADDLPLAIAANATSKITQLDDLYTLHSMGFRGEALASIAAVSRLSLSSKPLDQEHAMTLRYEDGAYTILPSARSAGTTVEVLDLFFNAPVRKKFLKTARSEYLAIEMIVKRFALSAPNIAIALKCDGKILLTLPAVDSEKTKLLRIRRLLGKSFIENAIYIDVEQGGIKLVGWVSGESYQRSQNDKQWVYINQRMVKDKLINHAIKRAYEGLLHPGRSPACVLYLTLPPADIDVNVHPTKHEVRFQQPRLIHDFIVSHLTSALSQQRSVPEQNIPASLPLTPAYNGVRHGFSPSPLFRVEHREPRNHHRLSILNARFILVFLQELPYLVDLDGVEQHRLFTLLNQGTSPLAMRPLLLPVSYRLERESVPLFIEHQSLFKQLGFEFDWMGNDTIVVRAITQALPQLNIPKLLQRISKDNLSPSGLLTLFIACQDYDAHQLDEVDTANLLDYLQQQELDLSPFKAWCFCLSLEKCQAIMSALR